MASGMPEAAICVQDIDVQCVLQFTLIHAAGCALHRHTSRVIHRLELSFAFRSSTARRVAPPRSSNESRTGIDPARTPPARRRRPSESFWLHESGESETVCRRRRSGDRHGDSLDLASRACSTRSATRAERDRYPRIRGDVVADESCARAVFRRFKTGRPVTRTPSPECTATARRRPEADRRCCRPRTRAASECHLGRRGPRIPRGLGDD